jgi:hypothetical protein
MIVDINEVRQLHKRIQEINSVPLSEIQWVDDGNIIPVSDKAVADWKSVGLSNTYFVLFDKVVPNE